MSNLITKVLSAVGIKDKSKGQVFAKMPRDEYEVRNGLISAVAGLAKIPESEIDTTKTFAQLGFDSLQAMKFAGLLEKSLGLDLEPTLMWDHPTVDALAGHLSSQLDLGQKRSIA